VEREEGGYGSSRVPGDIMIQRRKAEHGVVWWVQLMVKIFATYIRVSSHSKSPVRPSITTVYLTTVYRLSTP